MWQTLRRLRRILGWWGGAGLVFVLLAFWLIVVDGAKLQSSNVGSIVRVCGLLVAGLVIAGMKWGTYSRSVETTPYQQVLPPLIDSHEEFCLLLRPFGSDGEVAVTYEPLRGKPQRWRITPLGMVTPTLTLEQVMAIAARSALGVRAYAMVDVDLTLAPPGPVYLRSSYAQWKTPARELIRRAHTIAVLLPPNQSLRASMDWEVQEIVRQGRQSRVVIVLPPPHRRQNDHPNARRQAAVLLAALQSGTGLENVPARRVESCLAELPDPTLVVKVAADGSAVPWTVEGGGRRHRAGTRAYVGSLVEAIKDNEQEWAGLGFRGRYGARPRTGR